MNKTLFSIVAFTMFGASCAATNMDLDDSAALADKGSLDEGSSPQFAKCSTRRWSLNNENYDEEELRWVEIQLVDHLKDTLHYLAGEFSTTEGDLTITQLNKLSMNFEKLVKRVKANEISAYADGEADITTAVNELGETCHSQQLYIGDENTLTRCWSHDRMSSQTYTVKEDGRSPGIDRIELFNEDLNGNGNIEISREDTHRYRVHDGAVYEFTNSIIAHNNDVDENDEFIHKYLSQEYIYAPGCNAMVLFNHIFDFQENEVRVEIRTPSSCPENFGAAYLEETYGDNKEFGDFGWCDADFIR